MEAAYSFETQIILHEATQRHIPEPFFFKRSFVRSDYEENIFWNMTPCIPVDVQRRFGET
jgi:hypothetical protein